MIEIFNDVEVRNSGVIYSSLLEQIKRMHAVDPDKAGELAISAIELVLTGQMSSDDIMVDMLLQPLLAIRDKDQDKYEQKTQAAKNKKIEDMKLREIAELYMQGYPQAQIGERLGIKQQTISYRLTVIKTNYPELLQKNGETFTKVTKTTKKENLVTTKVTKSENLVKPDVYQNTKTTNFVQVGEVGNFVEEMKDIKTEDSSVSSAP
jgi:hypothetical protein